jgi:PAS domain S-box-containing protein
MKELKQNILKIKIIFLLAICILLFLSIKSYLMINQMIEESKMVSHTQEVKLELNKLFSILLSAESSQRGYVLTRDSLFLQPVINVRKKINLEIEAILRLTSDNPRQQLNLKTLLASIDQRIDYLNKILIDSKLPSFNTQKMIKGKALMEDVITQINIMIGEEERLLTIRTNSLNQSSNLTPIYSIILVCSAIIIIFMSYFKIMDELNNSKKLKLNIEQSKNELEKSYELLLAKTADNETKKNELIVKNDALNNSEITLKNSLKEISDYKHALDETAIVSISDKNGILKMVNANFCTISKYNEEELIGQHYNILNSGYHSEEFKKNLWAQISDGKIWKGEILHKAKDGSLYWLEATIIPFLDVQGQPYQYLTIKVDITERKKIEEKLKKVNIDLAFQNEEKEKRALDLIIANNELVFQNNEKEKRAKELVEINKELESFNYVTSHDLQEPLRHIQSFASRIITDEKGNLSEKGQIYFAKINQSAKRMQILLTDLLQYSRATLAERKFEKLDLNLIVNSIQNEFKEQIVEKKAVIEAKNLGIVSVISFQFRQMLCNLISNALKFSKADTPPHIKISSEIISDKIVKNVALLPLIKYCHIKIEDNGIGFETQYKDKIFEIFQRLHDKQKIAGTGIGLAIVKKIVENHRGFITATGELNKGACFDIYLPLN